MLPWVNWLLGNILSLYVCCCLFANWFIGPRYGFPPRLFFLFLPTFFWFCCFGLRWFGGVDCGLAGCLLTCNWGLISWPNWPNPDLLVGLVFILGFIFFAVLWTCCCCCCCCCWAGLFWEACCFVIWFCLCSSWGSVDKCKTTKSYIWM